MQLPVAQCLIYLDERKGFVKSKYAKTALKHEEVEICPERVAGNFFILIA